MWQARWVAVVAPIRGDMMRPLFLFIDVARWAMLGVGAAVYFTPAAALAQNNAAPASPQAVVNLQTSAQVDVVKDVLSIAMTSTREGADAATVQAGLKQALDAALQEAKKVARPGLLDVQTGNFSLWPRYSKDGKVSGWFGSAELLLEGRDMAAIGQLVGRITTLVVGRVNSSISRELRDKTESELTNQAIARFRAKAADVTKQFGYVNHVVREVSVGANEPVFMVQDAKIRSQVAYSEAPLPIEAGKATVTVNVSGSIQMLK
jgi:predicted secreted protein